MSEFHGCVIRGERVSFICCDCGRFMKYDDATTRVIPQYGEPSDPEWEYVHKMCPPKNFRAQQREDAIAGGAEYALNDGKTRNT
jgi:hypothetical protein